MLPVIHSLHQSEYSGGEEEIIFKIIQNPCFTLESIDSHGQTSPENFWYDQETDEWVLLYSGLAEIEFQDQGLIQLKAGDHFIIPAHQKHRVTKVSDSPPCVWIALHHKK